MGAQGGLTKVGGARWGANVWVKVRAKLESGANLVTL